MISDLVFQLYDCLKVDLYSKRVGSTHIMHLQVTQEKMSCQIQQDVDIIHLARYR